MNVSSRRVVSLLLLRLMRCWQNRARLQLQWKTLLLEKFFAALLTHVLLANQHSVLFLRKLSREFLLELEKLNALVWDRFWLSDAYVSARIDLSWSEWFLHNARLNHDFGWRLLRDTWLCRWLG